MGWEVESFSFRLMDDNNTVRGIMKESVNIKDRWTKPDDLWFGVQKWPTEKSDHLADYLDLTFIIDNGGKLSTRPNGKRDDFDFHIVNFLFLSNNIPSGPSHGVYISQLTICTILLTQSMRISDIVTSAWLIDFCHKAWGLKSLSKNFMADIRDLIEKYQRSVNIMVNDSFPG